MSAESFLRLVTPAPWMERAACRSMGPALFYPDGGRVRNEDNAAPAIAVCRGCPVRSECATLGADEFFGVWGGTVPSERTPRREGAVVRRSHAACGTPGGHWAHRADGTAVCDACREARNAADRDRTRRARLRVVA